MQEFDVEYYAKSLRHLKVLITALLGDSERFMTVYQHCNALTTFGSDTESDSENEAVKDMPSCLPKKDDLFKHHNYINQFLEGYRKENHTDKDFKMIKGMYTSKNSRTMSLKNLIMKLSTQKIMNYWKIFRLRKKMMKAYVPQTT